MARSFRILGLVAGALSLIACAEGGSVDNGSFTKELALSPQVDAPAVGEQTQIRIAAGRTLFLAVWLDGRSIMAARVRDGELLDAKPMLIHRGNGPTVPDVDGGLTVGANGDDFLVLWTERHVQGGDLDVRFARVSGAGVVLDPGGRALAETSAYERAPSVLSTEYGWVTTFRSDDALKLVRLDPFGRNWESETFTVATGLSGEGGAALSPYQRGAMIAYGTAADVEVARVDFAGPAERLGSVSVRRGGILTGVTLGKLGEGYLVGFAERLAETGVTSVVRLNRDGLALDAQPMPIADRGDRAPGFVWNGQIGLAAVESENGIELFPISGQPLVFGERVTMSGTMPVLSAIGGEVLLGFVRNEGGVVGQNTLFRRVTPFGSIFAGSERLLSRGPDVQQKPAMAMGRYGSLVAWTDTLNAEHSGTDVRYAQLSLAGEVQRTGTLGTAFDDFAPAVATDGAKYFVAWGDGEGAVRVALISEIGDIVRTERMLLGESRVAAAWNGKVYMVVTPTLRAARFDRMGVPLDSAMAQLDGGSERADQIALAPTSDGFLAAYHWNNGHDLISALRIGPNATVSNVPATIGFGTSPSIAWDGDRHTVAWLDEGAIKSVRVLPSGFWTEAPKAHEIQATSLSVAPADGGGVLLTWTNAKNAVHVATLLDGALTAPLSIADGTSPVVASFGARFGLAYEIPTEGDVTAVRAKLFVP